MPIQPSYVSDGRKVTQVKKLTFLRLTPLFLVFSPDICPAIKKDLGVVGKTCLDCLPDSELVKKFLFLDDKVINQRLNPMIYWASIPPILEGVVCCAYPAPVWVNGKSLFVRGKNFQEFTTISVGGHQILPHKIEGGAK